MPGALFGDVFPPAGAGGSRDLTGTADTSKYAMGTHWRPLVDGTVTAVRWFVPSGVAPSNADFAAGLLRSNAAGPGAGVTWLDWNTGVTRPGAGAVGTWVTLPLSAPVDVLAGDELYAVVRTDRYGFAAQVFGTGGDVAGADGNTVAKGDGLPAGFPNGGFVTGGPEASNPPNFTAPSSFNATFYGVDVLFTPASGGPIIGATGLPAELDAALPQGRRKRRTTGLATELDAPLAARRLKSRTTGLPAELAAPLGTAGRRKTRTTGLPAELDAVLGVPRLVIPGRPVAGDQLAGAATAAARPSTVEASDR